MATFGATYGSTTDTTWPFWADQSSATAASTVWPMWCANTASSGQNSTWEIWVDATGSMGPVIYSGIGVVRHPSAEEIAVWRAEGEERARVRGEASERAKVLLRAVLDRRQLREFDTDGHFHVATRNGERVYRLKPGHPPVRIKGEDGSRWSYCIHPREWFPPEDTVAALKLLIETDEEEFLRIANASRAMVA